MNNMSAQSRRLPCIIVIFGDTSKVGLSSFKSIYAAIILPKNQPYI